MLGSTVASHHCRPVARPSVHTNKMGLIALASLFVLVVMASSQELPKKEYYDVANAQFIFEKFMKEHNKQYKDDADKEVHYKAFCENLKKINNLNEQSTSATFGLNKFADYTEEESKSMFGLRIPAKKD